MLANLSAMAFVSLLVKGLTTDQTQIPLVEILFFRFAGTLPVFFWFMMRAGGWRSLKTDHPVAHLLRGAFGITSLSLFFYSLASIPLADATALAYAAPIFITIFAIPLLGERVGPWRWSAIAAGFLGVLLIAQPTGAGLARPNGSPEPRQGTGLTMSLPLCATDHSPG